MPAIQALGKREPGLELNALLSTREMLTAPHFLTHRPSGHARFPAWFGTCAPDRRSVRATPRCPQDVGVGNL